MGPADGVGGGQGLKAGSADMGPETLSHWGRGGKSGLAHCRAVMLSLLRGLGWRLTCRAGKEALMCLT
jgi:hypothetical protein